MKICRFLVHQPQRILLFALGLSLFACGNKDQSSKNAIKEYAVITLQSSTSELKSSYPATIRGRQDIEIRSKVNGFVTKLCVDEGSVVRQGQALFVIDPVQYEAAVKVAEATVNVAKANVATSRLTVSNKKELASKNIISAYDLQMAENQLATQEALLAQANAQLINARKDLSYTTITSPSNGVVGTIPYRVGSLVSSTTAAPLTTVSDIEQMYVYFSMNEKQLLGLTRQGGSMNEILNKMPGVELQLADGSIYSEKGKIETLSGVIEQKTGAVTLRATFPNSGNILRSGGTGSILVPFTTDEAILIPQKATYEIQDKKFVYLLTDSATVSSTEIQIAPLDNGDHYLVTGGIKVGDQIVIEGVSSLKNGMPIKAITPEQAAANVQVIKQQAAGK